MAHPQVAKQERSKSSKASSGPSRIIAANPTDIICGRGFHIVNHRGNLNLHLLVNDYREEYLRSKRTDKTRIIKHVLGELKSNGARFIRKVSNGRTADEWEEVDDETAYKKVSHALRLRTQNESNREDGPIAAAESFRHEPESDPIVLPSDQLGDISSVAKKPEGV